MAFELRNSFQGISLGSAVTTGNSGGTSGNAFTAVSGTVTVTAAADITAAFDRGATVSVSAGTASHVEWTLPTPTATVYFRRYFKATQMPAASARLMRFLSADGLTLLGEVRVLTNGQVLLTGKAGQVIQQTLEGAYVAGNTMRIEVGFTAGVATLRCYPGESSTPINVSTLDVYEGDAIGRVRFGVYFLSAQTWSCEMAGLGASDTAWIGAEPTAWPGVFVWNGNLLVPAQGVYVWNGTAKVPAAGVTVTSLVEGTSDAGAEATTNYTPPGGAIYVSTSGNDTTGTGSIAAPYATIAKAETMVAVGGTIVVRGGVYHEGGATAPTTQTDSTRYGLILNVADTTLQAYPGETVWLDGSSIKTGWAPDSGHWSVAHVATFNRGPTFGWNALDGTETGWQWINPSFPCAAWPEQVFIDGVPQTQVATVEQVVAGTFFVEGTASGTNNFTFTSAKYHIGTDPTGKEVRITDRSACMLLLATGVRVRGIKVRRFGATVADFGTIKVNRADCVLENVVVEDCSNIGISLDEAHNAQLIKVTSVRNGLLGGMGNRSDHVTLDRCVFTHNTTGMFNRAPVSGGWKHTKSQNLRIRNSVVSNNYRQGYWTDESVTGGAVVTCDFQNNGGNGCVLELSDSFDVVDCLFTGNARNGLYVSGTNRARVWCNTFANNGSEAASLGNLHFNQDARRPATFPSGMDSRQTLAWHEANCSWDMTSIEYSNNVSDEPATTGSAIKVADLGAQQGGWNGMGVVADGNLYCQKDANVSQMFFLPLKNTSQSFAWASIPGYRTEISPQESNARENRGGGSCVLDGSFRLTALGTSLALPRPIPAYVAALINRPTGTLVMGATR